MAYFYGKDGSYQGESSETGPIARFFGQCIGFILLILIIMGIAGGAGGKESSSAVDTSGDTGVALDSNPTQSITKTKNVFDNPNRNQSDGRDSTTRTASSSSPTTSASSSGGSDVGRELSRARVSPDDYRIPETAGSRNTVPTAVPASTPPPLVPTSLSESTPMPRNYRPGMYRVTGFRSGDRLNVRSGPGADNRILFSIGQYDDRRVLLFGPIISNDKDNWIQIETPSGQTGWVNAAFLRRIR